MKTILLHFSITFVILCCTLLSSCQDEIDKSAIYTFTGQTVTDILSSDSEFNDFYELTQMVTPTIVSKSSVSDLVSARGHYTCFAPTDEAIQDYLNELFAKGVITQPVTKVYDIADEQVRDSIMKVIVLNSIIDCGDNNQPYSTFDFQNASTLPLVNLNNRLLRTDITAENGHTVYKVSDSPVIRRDMEATNGYVHKMGKVVAPNNSNLSDLMQNTPNMTFFNHLLQQTGLCDTLKVVRDEAYENGYLNNTIPHTLGQPEPTCIHSEGICPEHRNIGFTLFVEPDEVYRQNGIGNIEQLIDYLKRNNYYTNFGYDDRTAAEGGNYKDSNHMVYQFTAYHILPFAQPYDRLTIHCNEWMWNYREPKTVTVPVFEYNTTLNTNPRRMIKITESKYTDKDGVHGICLNRYTDMIATATEYDEVVNSNTLPGIFVERENTSKNTENGKYENEAINGNIFPIGEILAYDEETMRNKVLNERIRFDVESLCNELMTNNLRGLQSRPPISWYRGFPHGYFGDNLTWTETTQMFIGYGWGNSGWWVHQGNHYVIIGNYDVTIKLPPVPFDGTYELRYDIYAYNHRGMAQVYFGEKDDIKAIGIPLDFRMGGLYSEADHSLLSPAGWEQDVEGDQDYNDFIDKRMRNNGFMKGPNYWGSPGNPTNHARSISHQYIRRILLQRNFERNKIYYLRIKSVMESVGKDLLLDCLELVPSNIYNNPEKKEDIW